MAGIWKSIGKAVSKSADALGSVAEAADNGAKAIGRGTKALDESVESICDDIVKDLKIDSMVNDAKREKKLFKAQTKTERIIAELKAMQATPVVVAAIP